MRRKEKAAKPDEPAYDISQAELLEYQNGLASLRRLDAECKDHGSSLIQRYLEGASVEPGRFVPEVTELGRGHALAMVRKMLKPDEDMRLQDDEGDRVRIAFAVVETGKVA